MTVRSAWHINPGQTRADTRLAPVGTMTPVDAMTSRAGVIPGGTGLNLTGSVMTGTVAVGRAVVQGTAAQGAYPMVVTAGDSFTVANGHASLPRIDSVFIVAYDQLYDTSGQTLAAIVYTQGTANASPVAPTAPATGTAYLKLWDIAVPAGASSGSPINWGTALTDRRVYTTAVGGINPGGSSVAGAYAGQWRDGGGATGILERYSGSAWEAAVRLGNSGKVEMGDVNLYRGAANQLKSDDDLLLAGAMAGASNMTMGAWNTFTPTWTTSGTAPTPGNATLTSRWCRIGRQITWIGNLKIGSTTNPGTGLWFMSMPVAAANNGVTVRGVASYVHSGDNEYVGLVTVDASQALVAFVVKDPATIKVFSNVSNTFPIVPDTNVTLTWTLIYEAVS